MNETVKEWAEYWLAEYDGKNSKPTTVQAHRYLIRNHIILNIGETELTMLTEQDVLCFLDELSLGSAGKRNVSAVLRRIMQQAEADGLIRRNPVTTGLYHCGNDVRTLHQEARSCRKDSECDRQGIFFKSSKKF